MLSFLDQASEDVLGFGNEMTNVDRTQPSQAASAFNDIFERAKAYSDSLWNDYDLSGYGLGCDTARIQISNAAGWFSNAAGWVRADIPVLARSRLLRRVAEAAGAGFAALQNALVSRASCAAGR